MSTNKEVCNRAPFIAALNTLTPLEQAALASAWASSEVNGHDFGYTDEIFVKYQEKGANGALVANLIKKGIIERDDEFGQFCFAGFDWSNDQELLKHEAADIVEQFLKEHPTPGWLTNTPAAPAEAPAQPVTKTTTSMKTSDISAPALALFRRIIKELDGVDVGEIPSFEVFEKVKVDKPALEELTKAKITASRVEKTAGRAADIIWIGLADKGVKLKEIVEGEDLLGDAPTVVDTTRTTAGDLAKGHKASTGVIEAAPKAKPASGKKATPVKPAAATKPAPVDRAALRYEAIREVMTAVKADDWKKSSYKPMLAKLKVDYAPLFAKLKTAEKIHAYGTGIIDFCLAASRKLETGKPAGV